jgi:uncharacterized protein YciI
MSHMLAVRIALSDAEKQNERNQYLGEHKRHLRETPLNIILSGPVLDTRGRQIGGMVLAEVDALEDIEKFSDADPFIIHKVYNDVIVGQWAVTIDNR